MQEYSIVTFSSGELTPKSMGRIDSKTYLNGCETLKNNIVIPQGGVTRRPGTYYLDTLMAGTRLIEFEGLDGVGYVLAFHNLKLDVYLNGVEIAHSDITAYWTTEQIKEMQFAIDGNTMYIVHKDVKPYILTYTPATVTFAFTAYTHDAFDSSWDIHGHSLSDTDYMPSAVTFYEGRVIFAASNTFPTHMWGSDVKDFATFKVDLSNP